MKLASSVDVVTQNQVLQAQRMRHPNHGCIQAAHTVPILLDLEKNPQDFQEKIPRSEYFINIEILVFSGILTFFWGGGESNRPKPKKTKKENCTPLQTIHLGMTQVFEKK